MFSVNKCIVIGAGVLGSVTAYKLAKAGAEVTVIDRKDKGQATDAAAGIVCPWLSQRRNKAWYQLAKGGAKYYPSLIAELEADGEIDTGYAKVGALSIHTDEKKLSEMIKRAEKRRVDAPEIGGITLLSSDEAKAKFPPLADGYGAVYVSGAARVDGRRLRNALNLASKKRGVHFINGEASLYIEHDNTAGVRVDNEIIKADKIIVTAGAWAEKLLRPLGVNFLVSSQKAQIVHLESPNAKTENWPVVMPPNDQYLLSFENGRIIAGATHENDVGFDHRVTAGGLREIFDKALAVAPGLEDSTLVETRVGFRPFTPGFLPVIGNLPNFPNVLAANGLGASGLTMGPYIGSQLAKLALNEPTDIDLSPYDLAGAIG